MKLIFHRSRKIKILKRKGFNRNLIFEQFKIKIGMTFFIEIKKVNSLEEYYNFVHFKYLYILIWLLIASFHLHCLDEYESREDIKVPLNSKVCLVFHPHAMII